MKIPGHKEIKHSPQYWKNRVMCLRMRRKQSKSPENITGMSETHLTEVREKLWSPLTFRGMMPIPGVFAPVHKEQTPPKLNWRKETQNKTTQPILPG